MSMSRRKKPPARITANQRRGRPSFAEVLSGLNRRAHEQANRRSGRRELRSVQAAIAAVGPGPDLPPLEWPRRVLRWLAALALLPLGWVTTWTFLCRFSQATVHQGFWQSREFWYFATGALLMAGWFASGLARTFFLYLYVLGHELTHAIFVLLFRGKVTDFHVSAEGGYITTNKTNLIIALSPYFVPFWSVVCALLYGILRLSLDWKSTWDPAFYAAMGVSWTFHMTWTLWMIPRDQPDLRENGTLLSLAIIYLANITVLSALFCVADGSPLQNAREFAQEWIRHAVTWGDAAWRWSAETWADMRVTWKF